MSELQYTPSDEFSNVNGLLGNHYRFVIEGLSDLTFFVQSFTLPSVVVPTVPRANPFNDIPEVGDHLTFNPFTVSYLIDNDFKTYFSLFYWLKGYGFPRSYQEILDFNQARTKQIANPRPQPREIQKTTALLTLLQPDNDTAIAEVSFVDVFPIALGELPVGTTEGEPPILKCQVTFACTDFNVLLM